jgi:molybdopterin-guanine dinucleotide biosynthesis protein A
MTAGGIVLGGGRSSRMGRPKAWLAAGGETFLGRTVRVVGGACSPVVVVAAAGQELPSVPAEVVRDAEPAAGPLEGLLAGLTALAGRCDIAFVAACDLPGLTPEVVRAVLAGLGDADACVPVCDGAHPLAAAYRLSVVETVRALRSAGRHRMTDLLDSVNAVALPADRFAAALRNVNTPAEYAAACR